MGNNTNTHQQWAPDPIKPDYKTCGAVQPAWPYKICNRKAGHDGGHCERKQVGIAMVETWWGDSGQ